MPLRDGSVPSALTKGLFTLSRHLPFQGEQALATLSGLLVLRRGGSVIVSPLGDVLAGPPYGEEGLLIADVDPSDWVRGKYDLDVSGHYARPDVFQLSVNRSPQKPVVNGPAVEGVHGDTV